MVKRKEKKGGFTLIELLAVIAILALVLGLVGYVVMNVINGAKENSYKVTINNIESEAGNYLMENGDRLFYVSKSDDVNLEYQCITVQDLIENGYFKNDVLESQVSNDRNVELGDYVYIERNVDTKTVVKAEYLVDEDVALCDSAVKATGDVAITVTPIEWSSYKEITLRYKVRNYYNIEDYSYEYSYDDMNVLSVISDEGDVKKLKVTDNGTITGYIRDKNGEIVAENSKDITNIDKTPPVIVTTDIVKIYGTSFDLYEGVTITDNSGLDVSSKVFLGGDEITSYSSLVVGENVVSYEAVDKFGNVSDRISRKITLVMPDKEFDYLEEDQIYPVVADGTYIIEAYGAQGGNSGGLGGYVKVEIDLKEGDTLVINTGGINGYNGGGGYLNNRYVPGGGATTVRLNNVYVVIAAGGGAKGNSGSATVGGSGNGTGGSNVGAGAGLSGSNGGGGSSSIDYSYEECDTCGGGCKRYDSYEDNCTHYKCNCREQTINCPGSSTSPTYYCYTTVCDTCETCEEITYCKEYEETYDCNCETITKKSKSGNGGSNSVGGDALMVENVSGNRNNNGYVKISYKLED